MKEKRNEAVIWDLDDVLFTIITYYLDRFQDNIKLSHV